jgi:hypothetical protein
MTPATAISVPQARRAALACVLTAWALGAGPLSAASELNAELEKAAGTVVSFLQKRGENRVAVGQFTGSSRMPSSSGASIAKELSEALARQGVEVSRKALLEVKGDFLPTVNERQRGPSAILKARILDRNGETLFEFDQQFVEEETVTAMFGLTVEIPPDAGPRERKELLRVSIDEPQTHFTETKVRPSAGSPYAIELLVRQGEDYVPRPPADDEGLAFASINPDETYAVRIYNDSDFDAAARLSIDGINLFAFSDNPAYREMGLVIVPAHGVGTIRGWHRTNEVSDSFLVTDYAKSAAAELKQEIDLGMVTCTFSAAWPEGSAPPPDESQTRGQSATARGAEVAAKYKQVARHIGRTRAAVTVRYAKPLP